MRYYGYGEQTPSLYVQITATNTSTGSLDAQQQAPFAVDTSQYPFNVAQQNYCNFPGLSEFFRLLPGCGASSANSTANTAPTSSNCNTYGLPQFLQPYLPGCGGAGNGAVPQSQTPSQQIPVTPSNAFPTLATTPGHDNWSMQAILGIIISTLATFLFASLILKKSNRLRASYLRTHLKLQRRVCSTCGTHLQPTANFCSRCSQPCPDHQQTSLYTLPSVNTIPQTTPIQTNKDSETNTILLDIDAMKRELKDMKDELLKKKHKDEGHTAREMSTYGWSFNSLLKKRKETKKHKETELVVESFTADSSGYEQTKWDAQKKRPES
jgi:hypothetical protein